MNHDANPYPSIPIQSDKRKAGWGLLGSAVFVAGGIMLLLNGESLWNRIIGLMNILFFGLAACAWTKQLFNTQPIWIIDENGIFHTSSRQLIEWHQISDLSVIHMQRQKMLCIQLFDETRFARRLHGWQKYLMILNQKMGYHGLYIPAVTTAYPIEALAETLEHYRRHGLQRGTPFQAA